MGTDYPTKEDQAAGIDHGIDIGMDDQTKQ